ncbi:hypothetical protein [Cohnella mopanensis]
MEPELAEHYVGHCAGIVQPGAEQAGDGVVVGGGVRGVERGGRQ